MYTLSVPISVETLNEQSYGQYGRLLTQMGAKRVFLVCIGEVYSPNCMVYTQPERLQQAMAFFRTLGLEVGVWINTLGHGELLSHQRPEEIPTYTKMEGLAGETAPLAFCPTDACFTRDFARGIAALGALKPDLIMLDDDLRYHGRKRHFELACFCPNHMRAYEQALGAPVNRQQLRRAIFTGGQNPYRDAFMDVCGQSLLDFCRALRCALDEVAPEVRMGPCITAPMWDFCGTDVPTLAKTLAGSTRPFARIIGAPYHDPNVITIIERSRQQLAWRTDPELELFCEGDTYPRPRYNVPSRPLELFDLAMFCEGSADGMLQYLFDYNMPLEYETGYARRLMENMPLRRQVAAMFAGKTPQGVQVYDRMHKLRHWQLEEEPDKRRLLWLQGGPSKGVAADLMGRSGIPTAYGQTEYPLLLMGENARYVPPEQMKNGAIVDITAARLLQERGIDVGLLSQSPEGFDGETFLHQGQTLRHLGEGRLYAITCAGQVESRFAPQGSPASYRYENSSGQRFLVLAMDAYGEGEHSANYLRSWYRRSQLTEAVRWLCGKPLPAILDDAPETWVLCSRAGDRLAVAVCNPWPDGVARPRLQVAGAAELLQTAGCTAAVSEGVVELSSLAPYGFAAFEVRLV